jgi:hypothetical protein
MNVRETWLQIPNRDCCNNTIGKLSDYNQRIRHLKQLWKSDECTQLHDRYQAKRLQYNEMIDDATYNHKLGRVRMTQSVRYDSYKLHENYVQK